MVKFPVYSEGQGLWWAAVSVLSNSSPVLWWVAWGPLGQHSPQQSGSSMGQRTEDFSPPWTWVKWSQSWTNWFLLLTWSWLQRFHYTPCMCLGLPLEVILFRQLQGAWSAHPRRFGARPIKSCVQRWCYISASQRRRCGNIKAASAWTRIQEQLFGELGLWHQMAEATPCSLWELDWREGPARMRKRIRRLSPLEAPNQERLKVRIRCNQTGCFQTGNV